LEIGTGVVAGLAWLVHALGPRQDMEVVTVELDDKVRQAVLDREPGLTITDACP
jgi:hypothetical protein